MSFTFSTLNAFVNRAIVNHLLGLLKSTPTLPMGRGGNFSESYTDLQLSLTQTSKMLE